jgi:hypothetical protein
MRRDGGETADTHTQGVRELGRTKGAQMGHSSQHNEVCRNQNEQLPRPYERNASASEREHHGAASIGAQPPRPGM